MTINGTVHNASTNESFLSVTKLYEFVVISNSIDKIDTSVIKDVNYYVADSALKSQLPQFKNNDNRF